MFSLIKTLKIFFVISFVLLTNSYISYCNDIYDEFSNFLLNESDIKGYYLNRQYKSSLYNKIEFVNQGFLCEDSGTKTILIRTYIFKTPYDAIWNMAYLSGFYASIFYWGSFDGSIVGDNSWVHSSSLNQDSIIFVRGNVGIHIGKTGVHEDDYLTANHIASKILTKINTNLSPEIIAIEEILKEKQISEEKYMGIASELLNSEIMNGFSYFSTWDSKWIDGENSYSTGIRMKWKNADGVVIGIDICEFESEDTAKYSGELHVKNLHLSGYLFDMDNPSYLKTILEERFQPHPSGQGIHNLSAVSTKNRIAVHIYEYDPIRINYDYFVSVVSIIADRISFLESSTAVKEGTAAEQPQTFTLFQNLPNPFNQATAISYELRRAGIVSLRIYNLLGSEVALLEEGYRQPGRYHVFWDGKDSKGNPVSSGIYLYRLKVGSKEETKRMTLVR